MRRRYFAKKADSFKELKDNSFEKKFFTDDNFIKKSHARPP